ncbi:MAG: type I pantothenate kinase [Coxiella sp. RIFCSPHIGHO2_12_FULL_42_15]|nr:MAG: type I pantothenate kinase [Coxiella sp. RIFCSPHIGHO2_12_FULL_42_15]
MHNKETSLLSPYLNFTREEWGHYRLDTPLLLSEKELEMLHGQIETVSRQEVEQVYLPLSRLLSLYVTTTEALYRTTGDFLGNQEPKVPFILGIAGSVAVGKSTTSRVLKALLSHWPTHPRVAVITTDGFLYPNKKLIEYGMMERKGFPGSYDIEGLLQVLHALKSGQDVVEVPIYSHHLYDVVPNQKQRVEKPDIVIIEGLNILQTRTDNPFTERQIFLSDYFDFSLFVDADMDVIREWYIKRVLMFWRGPFQQKDCYFHFLAKMNQEEVIKFAERVWREINEINLKENILPFRQRARLILKKSADHSVQKIKLRKL